MALLSGCSSFGTDGGLFGGSECESKEARDFMENAEANVFFAFDSSALSMDATEVVETQVKWLKKHDNVDVVVQGYCPFVLGNNEEAWAQNRRAVTVISSVK